MESTIGLAWTTEDIFPDFNNVSNCTMTGTATKISLIIILSATSFVSLICNGLMILTIVCTDTLRTPPNILLVNMCVTSLFLTVAVLIALSSTVREQCAALTNTLGLTYYFFIYLCFIVYLMTFSSIGSYRSFVIKHPLSDLTRRKVLIQKLLVVGWTSGVIVAVIICVSFRGEPKAIVHNPFVSCFCLPSMEIAEDLNAFQIIFLYTFYIAIVGVLVLIVRQFHYIMSYLMKTKVNFKNRVHPIIRNLSISSTNHDNRTYRADQLKHLDSIFTITNGKTLSPVDTVSIRYRRQTLPTIDDVLENPQKYQYNGLHKKTLQAAAQNRSDGQIEFTDISPEAALNNLPVMNDLAAKGSVLKRDQYTLGAATKNSVIMFLLFLTTATPAIIVCTIPGIVDITVSPVSTSQVVCLSIYHVNCFMSATWYLASSRRVRRCVRKCVGKMWDSALAKLNLKP